MIQKLTIQDFLQLAQTSPVFDVRSPGEYDHAHIPGAYNLPLFTDEERKIVGTAYKQQSKQAAIKIGLDYFGIKMKAIIEVVEAVVSSFYFSNKSHSKLEGAHQETENGKQKTVLVHCWRGGMRSAGIAWLLDLYGFKVFTLVGGYKAYRKWVREQFEKPHQLSVLGGYTGSGKTIVLHQMKEAGFPVIDLEKLASHKGSAFGALGEAEQPTQEMFENKLANSLNSILWATANNQLSSCADSIWIEDESQRIGNIKIPDSFWKQMRNSNILFLDIPFEERLNYLTTVYGQMEKEKLSEAIIRIQKRLGGLDAKNAINFLSEDNHKECFRILLKYYDKSYNSSLYNRENPIELINKITAEKVNAKANTDLLINEKDRNGINIVGITEPE